MPDTGRDPPDHVSSGIGRRDRGRRARPAAFGLSWPPHQWRRNARTPIRGDTEAGTASRHPGMRKAGIVRMVFRPTSGNDRGDKEQGRARTTARTGTRASRKPVLLRKRTTTDSHGGPRAQEKETSSDSSIRKSGTSLTGSGNTRKSGHTPTEPSHNRTEPGHTSIEPGNTPIEPGNNPAEGKGKAGRKAGGKGKAGAGGADTTVISQNNAKTVAGTDGAVSVFREKAPPLQCNGCNFAEVCPEFKMNYECAFLGLVKARITSPADLMSMMQELLSIDLERARLAVIQERLAGGALDDRTSNRIDSAFGKLMTMIDRSNDRRKVDVTESVMEKLLDKALK